MSLQPLPTPVIFNLNDGQYVESILFIGFLPLLLLLVLMVALMVYYCIVNFSSDSSKSGKKRCCSANICCYMVSGKLFRLACQLQKKVKRSGLTQVKYRKILLRYPCCPGGLIPGDLNVCALFESREF